MNLKNEQSPYTQKLEQMLGERGAYDGETDAYAVLYGIALDLLTECSALRATEDNLRAQIGQGVPDGWQLVPKEPTPEMCAIDFDCDDSIGIDSARICYKAMLTAAPQAPQVERCKVCNYQHGHQIGCENNPVDIALKAHADMRIPDAVEHYGGVKSDEELFPTQASVVQQEPVAWGRWEAIGLGDEPMRLVVKESAPTDHEKRIANWFRLYTHPAPQQKPLTDKQIDDARVMTVVYRNVQMADVQSFMDHPKAVWFGWCHAPYQREHALYKLNKAVAAKKPLTDEQQIAEALRKHGFALVKTATGYDVMKLGPCITHDIGEKK